MASNARVLLDLCRRKMRMSGLCKVRMSGFMGGRGAHGDGANRFEPTRTGPTASATRSKAKAINADRSCQAAKDHGPSRASATRWFTGARSRVVVHGLRG